MSAADTAWSFAPEAPEARDAPMPVLALDAVSKSYESGDRALSAVSKVSLEVRAGSLTALMGPSGSGKTTLLSIMGGILRPTDGGVTLCGHDISAMRESDRSRVRLAHVGFVFQSYNLFPTLTARQNIEIVLDLKGIGRAPRRAQALQLLDHMQLVEKADAYPENLSGGQKQRVAIARALAGAPSLLLADEPTAALDFVSGRRIMKLFRDLARSENCAVVVVTHDNRIVEFADRVMTIEDGRIVTDDLDHRSSPHSVRLTATTIRSPNLILTRAPS